MLCLYSFVGRSNLYVAFYATTNGHTGHIGLALDNYDIKVNDTYINDQYFPVLDSVQNGTITYFDLWPATPITKIWKIKKCYEPLYFQYPANDYEDAFYLSDLYIKGIPKKKRRTPDGLIKINSSGLQDFRLRFAIDSIIQNHQMYNAVTYNCTDFIMQILSFHFGYDIKIKKENIFYAAFHTPNRLFKYLMDIPEVEILRDPQEKLNGSFFLERFIKRIFYRQEILDDKINSIT